MKFKTAEFEGDVYFYIYTVMPLLEVWEKVDTVSSIIEIMFFLDLIKHFFT